VLEVAIFPYCCLRPVVEDNQVRYLTLLVSSLSRTLSILGLRSSLDCHFLDLEPRIQTTTGNEKTCSGCNGSKMHFDSTESEGGIVVVMSEGIAQIAPMKCDQAYEG